MSIATATCLRADNDNGALAPNKVWPPTGVYDCSYVMFVVSLTLLLCLPASAASLNAVARWHAAASQGAELEQLGGPLVGRALAIMDTCMFDAWAAYDDRAIGTQLRDALRRPLAERTTANKVQAISYAAYRAATDLFPAATESLYKPLMSDLGFDPDDKSVDIETPTGIGNVACSAVLEARHHDKSNQLGDVESPPGRRRVARNNGPYDDWTGYVPFNSPSQIPITFPLAKPLNPDHWQPLAYTSATGALVVQMFLAAQWRYVTPFVMTAGRGYSVVVEPGPFRYGSVGFVKQAEELVEISSALSDRQKVVAEYWSNGPRNMRVVDHWLRFAQIVSTRDSHTIDEDVKMFFTLSNALLDASIAAWDTKLAYDSVRPVTAIELLFRGKTIHAWGGPGKGTVEMDGSQWIPYQPVTFPTPPSPEFVSDESTYSAAGARILELWTKSAHFGYSVKVPPGASVIEPGITPAKPVVLQWNSFADAADEAGMSQRYSGTHFAQADLAGRRLGRAVADYAWAKAQKLFVGSAMSAVSSSARDATVQ